MSFSSYYPESLINESERELRQEYTRLRDISQKRLKRLKQSEFSESETSKYWSSGEVPKLRDLKTKEEIAFALADLYGFYSSPHSTIKGAREEAAKKKDKLKKDIPKIKQTIDTLNRRWGLKLTPKTFNQFQQFMNSKVAEQTSKILSSARVLQLYKVLKEKGIRNPAIFQKTSADFMFFIKNLENLEAVNVPKTGRKTVQNYKNLIESEIAHGRDRSLYYKERIGDISLADLKPRKKGSSKRRKKVKK